MVNIMPHQLFKCDALVLQLLGIAIVEFQHRRQLFAALDHVKDAAIILDGHEIRTYFCRKGRKARKHLILVLISKYFAVFAHIA